ncbi:LysR family transcriptional regulator [Paraburkholderia youngii]|uniref:LysR family transcriptional regulator n=1 Tax=Paraburkholderia youngii TaxID=2782701 RepID=UPI003D1D7B8F
MTTSSLPLRGIAVFESASRLGSFQAAALELNLTPSAVSHQIRLLEETLGVQLFERAGRGVTLSKEGVEYARAVRHAVQRLRQATDDMTKKKPVSGTREVVNIDTPPSFSSCWLLPRLPRFLSECPNIDVRVNAERAGGVNTSADLIILHGDASQWRDHGSCLLEETVQPFCAPSCLCSGDIQSPAVLLHTTLIKTRLNPISWDDWFQSLGCDYSSDDTRSIQLDPSHIALAAAAKGIGVVLESDILAEQYVASGALLAPFPHQAMRGYAYCLTSAHRYGTRRAVDTAFDWIRTEFKVGSRITS